MPRLDVNLSIDSPVEKVYEVLSDLMSLPRWNIVVNEIEDLGNDIYFLKTNVGEMTNEVIERVPNERITSSQENSPMTKIGYMVKPKDKGTEATIWAEFELEDQRGVLEMAGEMFLKSLKVYMNHLKEGGKPKDFKKSLGKIKKV